MLGLIVIVVVVALALIVTVRTYNRLSVLRRQEDATEYNAALHRLPASMIGGWLGFRER